MKDTLCAIVFILFLVFAIWFSLTAINECDKAGGTLMKNAFDVPVCVQIKELK